MAARSQPCFSCMGLTKNVHPYCMLAIMHMATTPRTSCIHRNEFGFPAASVIVGSLVVSIALSNVFLVYVKLVKVFGRSWIRLTSGFLLHCQVFGIFFKMPNTWLSLFQRRYGFNPRSTVLELWYFAERIELRIRQNIGGSFCVG